MATQTSEQADEHVGFGMTPNVDLSHADRLTNKEHSLTHHEAVEFLEDVARFFDETYLHLDVKKIKEQTRRQQGLKWKALLITNRGRYHTEQIGYGVPDSLSNTFDALKQQISSRLAKLDER